MKLFENFKRSTNNNQDNNKIVLFLCVQNAGRSQMAEGFFKKYAPNRFKTVSAGTNLPTTSIQ
jgi:protein-tyrosine-phosphatase